MIGDLDDDAERVVIAAASTMVSCSGVDWSIGEDVVDAAEGSTRVDLEQVLAELPDRIRILLCVEIASENNGVAERSTSAYHRHNIGSGGLAAAEASRIQTEWAVVVHEQDDLS